jgi:cytochrome d ubiquinol oxidase subunit I
MIPAGFIAVLAGWFTAEVGRQPYVVYGLLRTAEATSPAVTGGSVAASLVGFFLVYAVIFGWGTYYLLKLIRQGPEAPEVEEQTVFKSPARPLSLPDEAIERAR